MHRSVDVRARHWARTAAVVAIALGAAAFSGAPAQAAAPFTMTTSTNAAVLASSLAGGGVTLTNATLTGAAGQAASFSGGDTAVGMASGVALSTGNTALLPGTNPATTTTSYNGAGDANLTALAGSATHDASVLQFDLVPSTSTLSFQYVYATEEQPAYSDPFALYVNGVNCARFPGSGDIVTNINLQKPANAAYLINNGRARGIAVARLSTVLTCTVAVSQGVSNHIKIAIADDQDYVYDTAVFILGGSLNAGLASTTTYTGATTGAYGATVAVSGDFKVTSDSSPLANTAVTFQVGTQTVAATTDSAGHAAATITLAQAPGAVTARASFPGDASYSASSATAAFTITQAASTTSLAVSATASTPGQQVTMTATVAGSNGVTPTGTVAFRDGATLLGSVAVNGAGVAVFNTSSLSVGSHSLTATYAGSTNLAGSASSITGETVAKNTGAVSIVQSAATTVYGASFDVTATVSETPGGGAVPTGTVQLFDGTTLVSTASLTSGGATLSTSTLGAGDHNLTVVYSGDSATTGATSAVLSHTVTQATSTTQLTSAPAAPQNGDDVTLTATVVGLPGITPAGWVTFTDGATVLGTVMVDSTGLAVLHTTVLSVGAHSVIAAYSGDADFQSSESAASDLTVNKATGSVSLAQTTDPTVFGGMTEITATVTASPTPGSAPTGSVDIYDGTTFIAGSSLSGGVAVFQMWSLDAGVHDFSVVYNGDDVTTLATSATLTHTIDQAASTTSLTTAPVAPVVGQPVTLTATIGGVPGALASGAVDFFDGTTWLGSAQVDYLRAAVLETSSLAVGSHSISATYSGDNNFAGSDSAPADVAVVKATGVIILDQAASTSVFGTDLDVTATVSATPQGASDPTGTVDLFDGTTLIDSASLLAGVASFHTAGLLVGVHDLTAVYSGDGVTTTATTGSTTHTITQADSTTSLTSSPAAPWTGDQVTLTATVGGVAGVVPTGSVIFSDGATVLGTVPLDSTGVAVLQTSVLSAGIHSVTATYSGDSEFNGSASAVSDVEVTKAVGAITLEQSAASTVFGNAVDVTATVTSTPAGEPVPTGTVRFYDDMTLLATVPLVDGVAVFQTASFHGGAHGLTGVYSGDSVTATSTSESITHSVTRAGTTTTLATLPVAPWTGDQVTLTATVEGVAGVVPTGSVIFTDGATVLGTVPLDSAGVAVFQSTTLAAGPHPVTATYSGDLDFNGSASAVSNVAVTKAVGAITLQQSAASTVFGTSFGVTATVVATPAGGPVPTGTVRFYDGLTLLATVPLVNGAAAYQTASFRGGAHSLMGIYSGNTLNAAANSPAMSHLVTRAPSSTILSVSPIASPLAGDSVTLRAVVAPATATGSISFLLGTKSIGTSVVTGGAAQLVTAALPVGADVVHAVYNGSGDFAASVSANRTVTVRAPVWSLQEFESTSGVTQSWATRASTSAFGGSEWVEGSAGAYATYAFTGSSLTYWYTAGPYGGVVNIYLDGHFVQAVDEHATGLTHHLHVTLSRMSSAAHVLTLQLARHDVTTLLVRQGTIDAFSATALCGVGCDTTPKLSMRWASESNTLASGGAYRFSRAGGATTTIRFTGTAIGLTRIVGPQQGQFQVLIDGVSRGILNNWAPTNAISSVGTTWVGLARGPHTLVVVVLGRPGRASVPTSLNVCIDRVAIRQ